ncbi:response regulator transcription factor [Solirubrobacter phytolaccae]|uniref:Response regulator transcription factor n=1 Tax=Solirubrobacter phytolaccae TaxID=1404360 RepID=A0A9X3N8X7_9ACTN|nr:response regulator transcription factor [Solirubrobacter phytolaccae]MDA0181664.1 response regulator transcription factor [Solirubrobacter phytolaccae]
MSTVIAEDSGLLRDGLVGMLERFDFTVKAAVGDAEQLLKAVDEHQPQLVITDVRMPPDFRDEGLRAALALRASHPGLKIVVLSQYVEQTSAAELLAGEQGGVGYLLKDRVADVRALVAALHHVLEGGTVVDPEVVRRLLAQHPLERLTARERETLALMAEGHSNSAIAKRLVVTETTVAKHIRNVFDKLDLPPTEDHHRRVLAVVAYLQG